MLMPDNADFVTGNTFWACIDGAQAQPKNNSIMQQIAFNMAAAEVCDATYAEVFTDAGFIIFLF